MSEPDIHEIDKRLALVARDHLRVSAMVDEHQHTLHGKGDETGLVGMVAMALKTQRMIVWLIGLLVTGIFTAVGSLVWTVVTAGLVK